MRVSFLLLPFLALIAGQTTPAPDAGGAGDGGAVGGNGGAAESIAPISSMSGTSAMSQISGSGVNLVSSLSSAATSVAASVSKAGTSAVATGVADATVASSSGNSAKSGGNIVSVEWRGVTSGAVVMLMGVVASVRGILSYNLKVCVASILLINSSSEVYVTNRKLRYNR